MAFCVQHSIKHVWTWGCLKIIMSGICVSLKRLG